MTYKYEEIEEIYNYLIKLKSGIDPFTDIEVDDTILRSSSNQKMLTSIIDFIKKIKDDNIIALKGDRRVKLDFKLNDEQKKTIEISNNPISISAFVYKINDVIDNTIMKKIRATQITEWLLEHDYLMIDYEKSKNKIPTKLANNIGISMIDKENNLGERYTVCLYDEYAQKFILEHINEIAQSY